MTSPAARHDVAVGPGTDPAAADTIVELLTLGLSAWTEPDPERRKKILTDCCVHDVRYASPLGTAIGLDQFTDLIGGVQRSYPGLGPVRTSAVDLHHRHGRLEWALRDNVGRTALTGLDLVTFTEQPLIAGITAFYGPTPPIRYTYGATAWNT